MVWFCETCGIEGDFRTRDGSKCDWGGTFTPFKRRDHVHDLIFFILTMLQCSALFPGYRFRALLSHHLLPRPDYYGTFLIPRVPETMAPVWNSSMLQLCQVHPNTSLNRADSSPTALNLLVNCFALSTASPCEPLHSCQFAANIGLFSGS